MDLKGEKQISNERKFLNDWLTDILELAELGD